MTDDEKNEAVSKATKAATALKPTFTGNSEQRKRLWRLALWEALAPAVRAEAVAEMREYVPTAVAELTST